MRLDYVWTLSTLMLIAPVSAPLGMAQEEAPASGGCGAAPWGFSGSSGRQLWPDAVWRSGRDTIPRSPERVAEQLSGTYTLLIVRSEGARSKGITEWALRLAPTPPAQDSAWRKGTSQSGGSTFFPLLGIMEYRRGGNLQADGTVAPHPEDWRPPPGSVRIYYRPTAGILRLEAAPFDAYDAGTPYDIYEVDLAGGFSGRWVNGGYARTLISTPFGTIAEQDAGYFCARREAPK